MSQSIESFIEQIVRKVVDQHVTGLDFSQQNRKSLVVANWKMNMDLESISKFVDEFAMEHDQDGVVICPPNPYIYPLKMLLSQRKINCSVGAQDVHWAESGAYTGDVAANQLRDIGVEYVLIGHSERRKTGETDELVNLKVKSALSQNLIPIICVGESLRVREEMMTNEVVTEQVLQALQDIEELSKIVIAYEPIWAIGTGKSATPEQAQEVHEAIRNQLSVTFGNEGASIPILYGGSVKASNAEKLSQMKDIDGVLVGGASLSAEEFLAITRAFS